MLKLFKKKTADAPAPEEERVDAVIALDRFDIGQSGVIRSIGGDGKIRRRLFDMGVTPGANVYLRKRAPLGDPIEVTLRDYELTLRKTEAAAVFVATKARKAQLEGEEAKND